MTPLYNANDYYRKMLDLHDRLRKSEEERIRLEERFTLLEHESRSRHEACINRLRMRYIDFLEEQQARDERNHQLLGALDRVDSSLALMSAKTDRLGALRKQYEASIQATYENRRPYGSVTGDSGVASQNDERQRRSSQLFRDNENEPLSSNRSMTIAHEGSANRTNVTPSRVGPVSSYPGTWSGIRCESSRMNQPSFAFSRYYQDGTSLESTRGNGSSASIIDNSPENRQSSVRSKYCLDPRESTLQSRRAGNTIAQSLPARGYGNDNSSVYQKFEYPLGHNNDATRPAVTGWKYADGSAIRDLANSGAYESGNRMQNFYNVSPISSRHSKLHEGSSMTRSLPRNVVNNSIRRNSVVTAGESFTCVDRKIATSPKLSEILRQELGEEEQDEYVGSIVENQLERYISKIRSLHRADDPTSLEELDQEQNTSGDLLNVTLSEDGLDLPIEDKPARVRSFPQELRNVLALAKDLANKTATSAINVANNIYHDIPAGDDVTSGNVRHDDAKFFIESHHGIRRNNEQTGETDEVQRLSSINRLLDETDSYVNANRSSREKLVSLAKNGISPDVARPSAELASRSAKNMTDIAKYDRNSQEFDKGRSASRLIDSNVMNDDYTRTFDNENVSNGPEIEERGDKFSRRSSSARQLEGSRHRVMSGEECVTDESLHDMIEDLEPWNLSALERRVQEIILNDEVQDVFVRRGTGRDVDETLTRTEKIEIAASGIDDESDVPRANERKIVEGIIENDEPTDLDVRWKNDDTSVSHVRDTSGESAMKNERDTSLKEYERVSSAVAEESTNRLSREGTKVSHEEESIREKNYVAGDNVADTSIVYGGIESEGNYTIEEKESHVQDEYSEDPNLQYGYNADGEYQGDSNEQYQGYGSTENAQYDGVQGEQYGYGEQQYVQDPNQQDYVQDPNRQDYVQDPNQQDYVQDPNRQDYVQDPNRQDYIQDPNQQDYVQDPNRQDYIQDPNQQDYVQDPNRQDYVQDPSQQDYVQDPNQQVHVPDSNQQDYFQDPNQQNYVQDPNQQDYVPDPNQQDYFKDPNQQDYVHDPNQQDYVQDPNQQDYIQDPNRQDYVQNPNQQDYVHDPNQQEYIPDPNQPEYIQDLNQREYGQDHNPQEYVRDPNQPEHVQDPNQQYAVDPNQQYQADPNQRHAPDSQRLYSALPNQQYPEDGGYAQREDQVYPAVGMDYSYPKAQEYTSNGARIQDQEGSSVVCDSEESMHQDPNKVIVDDQPADNEFVRSADVSETKISPKEATSTRKTKDVIKSILDSDTESTIERNVSNADSDFDFN